MDEGSHDDRTSGGFDSAAVRASNRVLPSTTDVEGGGAGQPDVATVFTAMPYLAAFDDVFHVAIKSAAAAIGARAVRIDQVMHGGDAVAETWRAIKEATVVVADVSTNEPDVLYELGLAHAWGKPTVQLCSNDYARMPFMVRNRETLLYQAGQTHLLAPELATYLRALLVSSAATGSQGDPPKEVRGAR